MSFISFEYFVFFGVVLFVYWTIGNRSAQNLLLVISSYVFYGYIHPWFCILLGFATVVDFACGVGMGAFPARRKWFLIASLTSNLGMLSGFKYFNFFTENAYVALAGLGLHPHKVVLDVVLPAGISFYTFQSLAYIIDVYRGQTHPRRNLLDFAVYVSFFPQLVSGPIERAPHLLPQIERQRRWSWDYLDMAWPLFVSGFLKKMVVADNLALYVDKIFMLNQPSILLLAAGSFAFTVQIYADFSGYVDIARASARLLGFELVENFRAPYLACSPSDFWRRWHISLSSWIRDYLYIPLGGSRVGTWRRLARNVLITMGLAGLWHGAAWNFVLWGMYQGVLLLGYRRLGLGGRWMPQGAMRLALARAVMFGFTVFGWLLFRSTSVTWLANALIGSSWGLSGDSLTAARVVLAFVIMYSIPLVVLFALDWTFPKKGLPHAAFYGLALIALMVFHRDVQQNFIYFQF